MTKERDGFQEQKNFGDEVSESKKGAVIELQVRWAYM